MTYIHSFEAPLHSYQLRLHHATAFEELRHHTAHRATPDALQGRHRSGHHLRCRCCVKSNQTRPVAGSLINTKLCHFAPPLGGEGQNGRAS